MLVIMSVSAFKSDVILYLLKKDYGKGVHYTSILCIVNYNNILEIYVFKWLTEMAGFFVGGGNNLFIFSMCVRGINFVSFYDFSIGFRNCSDSVVFFVLNFTSISIHSSIKSQN